MRSTIAPLLAALVILSSCGPEPSTSDLNYLLYRTNRLTKSVKKPVVNICLNGASSNFAEWENNIRSVILKWIEPMRSLTAEPLATNVEVRETRSGCDGFVNVSSGVWAHAKEVDGAIINMNDQGYFASYNVLLHEFGHGFGLRDTYMNRKSGNCMPGQPQSVMCNTSFDDLQRDDIEGITKVFQRTFPQDPGPQMAQQPPQPQPQPQPQPPTAQQTLPPTGTQPPIRTFPTQPSLPPPQTIGEPFSLTANAAVSEASNGKSYALFSIPSEESIGAGSLSMCQGDPTFCVSLGSWTTLKKVGSLALLDVYVAEEPLVLQHEARVTLRHGTAVDAPLKIFRLERNENLTH